MEDSFEDGFKASELTVFLDSIHHHGERSLEIIRVNTCKLFRALMKYGKFRFFHFFKYFDIFKQKRLDNERHRTQEQENEFSLKSILIGIRQSIDF